MDCKQFCYQKFSSRRTQFSAVKKISYSIVLIAFGFLGACNQKNEQPTTIQPVSAANSPSLAPANPGTAAPAVNNATSRGAVLNVSRTEHANADRFVYDPSGMRPEEIFSAVGKLATHVDFASDLYMADMETAEGDSVVYSGSSQDLIREQLTTLLQNKWSALAAKGTEGAEHVRREQEFIKTIGSANWEFSGGKASAKLKIKLVDSNRRVLKMLQFEGHPQKDGHFGAQISDQEHIYGANAICVDNELTTAEFLSAGHCRTLHVSLFRRGVDSRSTLVESGDLLIRNTETYLYIQGDEMGQGSNDSFDLWMGILLNTVRNPGQSNTVKNVSLSTTEVIGGRSFYQTDWTFNLAARIEHLHVAGELVKPIGKPTTYVQTHFEYTPRDQNALAARLSAIKLIKNDGHGNLQFAFKVKGQTNEKQLKLTVARIHPLTDQIKK